jgi:hypothetical protein
MSLEQLKYILYDEGMTVPGVDQLYAGQAITNVADRQVLRNVLLHNLRSEFVGLKVDLWKAKAGHRTDPAQYNHVLRSALLKHGITGPSAQQISQAEMISDGADRQAVVLLLENVSAHRSAEGESEIPRPIAMTNTAR